MREAQEQNVVFVNEAARKAYVEQAALWVMRQAKRLGVPEAQITTAVVLGIFPDDIAACRSNLTLLTLMAGRSPIMKTPQSKHLQFVRPRSRPLQKGTMAALVAEQARSRRKAQPEYA